MTDITKTKRIFYFDALRTLAILSVIMIHVFNSTVFMVKADYALLPSLNWWISCFLGSGFRTGVAIFLMLTGALTLGRKWEIIPFLKKRIPRVLWPVVFWGFVLSVFMVSISYLFPDFLTTIDAFTFKHFLHYLCDSYLAINKGFTQLWYFWMIIGVFLIMPVINKWVLNSDLKELEYFLVIWAITCVFEYTLKMDFPIDLSYFTGPIGLVVLGYYLRYTDRKLFNSPYWSLLFIFIGFMSNVVLFYLFSDTSDVFKIDRYSIMIVILVIGLFTLFKNFSKFNFSFKFIDNPDGLFRKSVFSIAKYSYGIYIIHRVFMIIIYKYLRHSISFPSLIITMFLGTLIVSWFIMAVLNKVPYLNRIIGVG